MPNKKKKGQEADGKTEKGMIQLKISSFFKTTLKKRKRRIKPIQAPNPNPMIQTLMTDYWHEFSDILTMDFWGIFTPYKNSEEFLMTFKRKNW